MEEWESRVNKLVADWEVIFKEHLEKLPSTGAKGPLAPVAVADLLAPVEDTVLPFADSDLAQPEETTEAKDDPEWVVVNGSSMIWAYRIVPAGEYIGLGTIHTLEFHLWFYRSGHNQVSPKPTYPYHKHAYSYIPMDVIEAFITAPSYGRAFHQLILGNAWKNLDPFRTNTSNGRCLWPNRPLPPDS